jgi:hypothetical protein
VSPSWPGGIGPDGVEAQGRCTMGSPGTWEVRSSPSKKSRNEPAASSGSEIVAALNRMEGALRCKASRELSRHRRIARRRRAGSPGDRKPQARFTRRCVARERNRGGSDGTVKRRKRSAAGRAAGWLSASVVPTKRSNRNRREPVEGRENPEGAPGRGLVGRRRAHAQQCGRHVHETPTDSRAGEEKLLQRRVRDGLKCYVTQRTHDPRNCMR